MRENAATFLIVLRSKDLFNAVASGIPRANAASKTWQIACEEPWVKIKENAMCGSKQTGDSEKHMAFPAVLLCWSFSV